MEALREIAKRNELALQPSGETSLLTRQWPPLSDEDEAELQRLWLQTVASYPNQALPMGTPDMYLMQWEKMVLRYKMETFRRGLSRAINESRFFPAPEDISDQCQAIARNHRERQEAIRVMHELDDLKAQCERERLEEGQRVKTEQEKRLDAILAAVPGDRRRR
jgi:hypothetical protein